MTLGETVRHLRLARRWTQQELAKRSGIAQGMITNVERGKYPNPTANTLLRLATAFSITVDNLLQSTGVEVSLRDLANPRITTLEIPEGLDPAWVRDFTRLSQHLTTGQRRALLAMAQSLVDEKRTEHADV